MGKIQGNESINIKYNAFFNNKHFLTLLPQKPNYKLKIFFFVFFRISKLKFAYSAKKTEKYCGASGGTHRETGKMEAILEIFDLNFFISKKSQKKNEEIS